MKRITIGKLATLLLLCCMQLTTFAQAKEISGTVKDANGQTMPGVSIVIKGTTQGTSTSLDGEFSLSVPDENAVLVFSFIGFTTQEIVVGTQTAINLTLSEALTELDEVVVTGYGVSKKSDLTGSLATLKQEDFNVTAGGTPENLIRGRVPGVMVTSNNGEPGAGSQIRIRGISTIRSGSQPLYVVDGVALDFQSTSPSGSNGPGLGGAPATNPLTFLNSNDILSIDILKDASASAIYGSRGANGVIIITTKKGAEGKSQVDYSSNVSFSKLPKQLDVLSAEEWTSLRQDELGIDPATDANNYGASTDWQDILFREAISQDHSLAFSGGNKSSNYRVSLGYLDQEGIMENSDLTRYTGRVTLTQNGLNEKLLFETNLSASQVIENRPPVGTTGYEGDILLSSLKGNPTWPTTDAFGDPFQTISSGERNPSAILAYTTDKTKTTRVLGSLATTVHIIKGLDFKVNFGLDYTNANRFIDQSAKIMYMAASGGSGQINNKELYNYLIENTLTYTKKLDIHSIEVLAGYSYQDFNTRGADMTGQGFATDAIKYTNKIGVGNGTKTISSYAYTDQMQSFFGRLNYNLLDKYLVTGTIRADGSSKFGENNKYGIFPSIAGAWRLSQEDFIKNLDVFSNLKLRLGWGQTGNSEIESKNSQYLYNTDASSRIILGNADGGEVISGFKISRTPNPDLTWETTSSTNLGLDFGVLNGRLSGTVDLFKKVTKDILLVVPSQPGSPTATVYQNIDSCEIYNKGIEIGITGIPVVTNDFSWEINGAITFMNSEVKNLPVDKITTGRARGQGMTDVDVQVITNGQPLNVFIGSKVDSIGQNGKIYYVRNYNGKKDSTMYLGNPQPDFTWSLNNTFKYKSFDLSVFIEGVHGNKIFNNTALLLDKSNLNLANNILSEYAYNNISFSSTDNPNVVSDRFIEDGSYVRLSSVTLGYTFLPKNNTWISSFRLYATGNNLLLITDYTGYDPDVNSSADVNGNRSFGLDITNYPKARTFILGLNVTF